jgi:hypothetical protein
MNRTLFLGDSHTCGYKSFKDMSFTIWNENNYASIYSNIHNKPALIYAQAGSTFRVYTDRLYTMFSQFDDIDEIYLCLTPFNRFTLAWDDWSNVDCIPVDFFTYAIDKKEDTIQRFQDETIKENRLQLFQKTLYTDYDKPPDLIFSEQDGLTSPDIRKSPFMPIKTFCDFNTYLEKRDFFNALYTWDNMCNDNGADLYIFNFMDRMIFPSYNNYYGKLKRTTISSKTVETFFREKNISHTNYLLEDNEHYDESYHSLIAETFLPWLKKQKKY